MSREVRRVPVGWQHPVEHNPHWQFQASTPYGMSKPASKLHGPTERFVSLLADYPGALADWEEQVEDTQNRTGWDWDWAVKWNLEGYDDCTCHPGRTGVVHDYVSYAEDGETEIHTPIADADQLHELVLAEVRSQRPDPARYMPVFDQPEDQLGWCLYQTVSEGTPVTPVFATADELIEHLCTVGQDWDQQPMRRAAAEQLVRSGYSLGSFVVTGGELLRSDHDADLITGASA